MKEHLHLLGDCQHHRVVLHGLPKNTPVVNARLVVLHSLPLIVEIVVLNVLVIVLRVLAAIWKTFASHLGTLGALLAASREL